MGRDFRQLPDDLPVPADDGAADHLKGLRFPRINLPVTGGHTVDVRQALGELGVLFVYPRTGTPGEPSPPGWDDIPGARGCTPQACAYRESSAAFEESGAALFGLSSQRPDEQFAFKARESIPYELISDSRLELATLIGLPVFEASGLTLYRRLTMVVREGVIEKAFYPVFPPDQDATRVLEWLQRHAGKPGELPTKIPE